MVWAQESAVALRHSLGRLAHFLGHRGEAEAHFRTALAITERIAAPYWIARTQLDFSDLLQDVGRTDEATAFVNRSLETAKTFGFAGLESRAMKFSKR